MGDPGAGTSSSTRKRKARPDQPSSAVLTPPMIDATEEGGGVIVGHQLNPQVASRSGLLAGLSSTRGLAELPDSLSPEDVQLWQTACMVDTQPSMEELMTVLRVADVLSDADPAPWVAIAAKKVLQVNWKHGQPSNAMLGHLLALPPHLLHRILSSCLTFTDFIRLYADLPPVLHDALITAQAATGTLTVPYNADAMFFVLLSKAVIPSPGLVAVVLPRLRSFTEVTAALLAQALAAQPSLATVDVHGVCMAPTVLRTFAAGLPGRCLPALSNLKLRSRVATPGDITALAECLRKLCSVREAALELTGPFGFSASESAEQLRLAVRYTASPVCMPALQALCLTEQLRAGGVAGQSSSNVPLLLSCLRAPALTCLELKSDAPHMPQRSLLRSLGQFRSIKKLVLDAEALKPSEAQMPAAAGVVAGSLPALHTAVINSRCIWVAVTMAATVADAAQHSLTSLSIASDQHEPPIGGVMWRDCQAVSCSEFRGDLIGLWAAVGRCSLLQHLQMQVLADAHTEHAHRVAHSEALAVCLGQLSKLTYLELKPEEGICGCEPFQRSDFTLQGEILAEPLQRLTALKHLKIGEGWRSELFGTDAVLESCAKLTELQELVLTSVLWDDGGLVETLCRVLPKLPSLGRLVLPMCYFDEQSAEELGEDTHLLFQRFPHIQILSEDDV